MKIDPYDALTIYRGTRVSIVFHLYCCSKYKLSTILKAIVANLSRFVTLTFRLKKLFVFCLFCLCIVTGLKELPLWDTVSMNLTQ